MKLEWTHAHGTYSATPLPGFPLYVSYNSAGWIASVGGNTFKKGGQPVQYENAEAAQLALEDWLRRKVTALAEVLKEEK